MRSLKQISQTSIRFIFQLNLFTLYADKIEEIGDEQLKRVIENLGGWPAANKSWDRSDFGLEKSLARVRRDFSIGILIEIMVSTDDRNSSLNIIQVRSFEKHMEHISFSVTLKLSLQ